METFPKDTFNFGDKGVRVVDMVEWISRTWDICLVKRAEA